MFTDPKFEYLFSSVTKRSPKAPSDLFRVEGPQSRDADDYVWTYQTCQPIPSCYFTILTPNWCIDFPEFNKIDLAE